MSLYETGSAARPFVSSQAGNREALVGGESEGFRFRTVRRAQREHEGEGDGGQIRNGRSVPGGSRANRGPWPAGIQAYRLKAPWKTLSDPIDIGVRLSWQDLERVR